ncbi:Fimbrial protein (Pilin), partial [uncultured Woeseiaceae bacterium]
MKNDQQGFTLIELMIVVAIIGILAAIAVPAYQRYTIRAQVAEGLNLCGPFKTAIAEFVTANGGFPTDNTDAGLSPPGNYIGKYVKSVSVNGAVVSIEYGNDAHAQISGQTVILTAMNSGGSVHWACTSGGVIPSIYLPS